MQIRVPYGRGETLVDLGGIEATVVAADRCGSDPICLALAAPIGCRPLRELVRPGMRPVIVTSDITRPCPTAAMLGPVLDELAQGGVGAADVTVVFGLGTHRKHTPAEQAQLLGEHCGRVRCCDSDPDDTVQVGVTSRGTPVEAFRPVVEADFRIALGVVEHHYFAGYSGGYKALVPGVCSARTIQRNHAMMTDSGARLGVLEGNPVREDIEEAAALIGLDFILNAIMQHGHVCLAAAGHPVHAHRWACRALDYLSMAPAGEPADVVVVGAGGYPKDINMYQAQKALDNAAVAVRENGIIIWVAECPEGLGNATFESWMLNSDPDTILARICEQFVLGGHKAAAVATVQKRAAIWLVSGLPGSVVRACGMTPYEDAGRALADALDRCGPNARITVIPDGATVVPRVTRAKPVFACPEPAQVGLAPASVER